MNARISPTIRLCYIFMTFYSQTTKYRKIGNHIKDVQLAENELHIWCIELPTQLQSTEIPTSIINMHERLRLEAFSNPLMRQNYLLIRIALRTLLGDYLNCPPKQVAIINTIYNKPQVDPQIAAVNLQFNLSHSANYAVIAFALNAPIGVDIELIAKKRNIKALLKRYFSTKTHDELQKLPDNECHEAFLRVWTKYEAYKKAEGVGLRGGDSDLYISSANYPAGEFHKLFPNDQANNHWVTAALNTKPEIIASVVTNKILKLPIVKTFNY